MKNVYFFQPSVHCKLHCADCYVKQHKTEKETNLQEILEVYKTLAKDPFTAQITISVDYQPGKDIEELTEEMVSVPVEAGQLHVTTRTIDSLPSLDNIDLISLSTLPLDYSQLSSINHKKLNYNHLLPIQKPDNLEEYIEHISKAAEVVDSIYLILYKKDIDINLDNNQTKILESNLRNNLSLLKTILKRTPINVRHKLTMDNCLRDCYKAFTTGYGCASNITKFQIWPDGSVSGCPYARCSDTSSGSTANDILENITKARKSWDLTSVTYLMDINLSQDDPRFNKLYPPCKGHYNINNQNHSIAVLCGSKNWILRRSIHIDGFAIRNDGEIVHDVTIIPEEENHPYKILLTKQEIDELRGATSED